MNVTEETRAGRKHSAAPENHPAAEPRNAAMDGLRGVAILLVLAGQFWAAVPHASDGWLATVVSKFAGYGGAGVTLFFVLSGYWIARGLIRSHGKRGFFGAFFLRRACRILPLYALLLGSAYVAAKVIFPLNADLWEPTVREHLPRWCHAAFMQNIFMALTGSQGCAWLNPTWFIAVEVQFYLLLPVLVWFFAPRWLPIAAGLGLLASLAFRAVLHAADAHVFLSSLTLTGRMDALFVGVLVACAGESAWTRAWLREHHRPTRAIAAVGGAAFLLLTEGVGGSGAQALSFVAGPSLLGLGCAGLIVEAVIRPQGALSRLLAARPLAFWGGISFCVFLAHQPVNSLVHGFLLQDWPQTMGAAGMIATFGSMALLALLGAASRRWLEQPVVAWSRRVFPGKPAYAVATMPEIMPPEYAPPLVRWTRGLALAIGRPTARLARAVVRVRS